MSGICGGKLEVFRLVGNWMPQALTLFSVASLGLHHLRGIRVFPIAAPQHTLKVLLGSSGYRENQGPFGNQIEKNLMYWVIISKMKSFLSEYFGFSGTGFLMKKIQFLSSHFLWKFLFIWKPEFSLEKYIWLKKGWHLIINPHSTTYFLSKLVLLTWSVSEKFYLFFTISERTGIIRSSGNQPSPSSVILVS